MSRGGVGQSQLLTASRACSFRPPPSPSTRPRHSLAGSRTWRLASRATDRSLPVTRYGARWHVALRHAFSHTPALPEPDLCGRHLRVFVVRSAEGFGSRCANGRVRSSSVEARCCRGRQRGHCCATRQVVIACSAKHFSSLLPALQCSAPQRLFACRPHAGPTTESTANERSSYA